MFFSKFPNDLAIDLGTAKTLVFVRGEGGTKWPCNRSKCSLSTNRARTSSGVSPAPLKIVVAAGDHLTVGDEAAAALCSGSGTEEVGPAPRRPLGCLCQGGDERPGRRV